MASANTNELYKNTRCGGKRYWREFASSVSRWKASMPSETIAELPLAAAAINFKTAIRRLLAIAVTMLLGALLIWTTTVGPACEP